MNTEYKWVEVKQDLYEQVQDFFKSHPGKWYSIELLQKYFPSVPKEGLQEALNEIN